MNKMINELLIALAVTVGLVLLYGLYKGISGPRDNERVILPFTKEEVDEWERNRDKWLGYFNEGKPL